MNNDADVRELTSRGSPVVSLTHRDALLAIFLQALSTRMGRAVSEASAHRKTEEHSE
jgi:hypothetical protein